VNYVSCAVCSLNWLPVGVEPCPVCTLRKKLEASIKEKSKGWADYPRKVVIKQGWDQAGRVGYTLGPSTMVVGQAWTPVLWNGEDDPDWHKTPGLEEGAKR